MGSGRQFSYGTWHFLSSIIDLGSVLSWPLIFLTIDIWGICLKPNVMCCKCCMQFSIAFLITKKLHVLCSIVTMWMSLIYDDICTIYTYTIVFYNIFDDIWWYMVIYDDIWWYMMIYDDIWWYMMIYDDIWWYMMIYDDIWWYMMIFDDIWWYMMIYDDIWWYMMIYDDIWWYLMIFDDIWWYMMIYDDICFWYIVLYNLHQQI